MEAAKSNIQVRIQDFWLGVGRGPTTIFWGNKKGKKKKSEFPISTPTPGGF